MDGAYERIAIWRRTSAIAARLPPAILRPLAGFVFAVVYGWVLFPVAHFYWYIPAGWRFAALAFLPWRYWPWIMGGEFAARYQVTTSWFGIDSFAAAWAHLTDPATMALVFLAPLGSLPGLIALRSRTTTAALLNGLNTPSGMGRLLLCALAAASGEAACNLLYLHIGHISVHTELGFGYARFVPGNLTGDYIGMIALAPALLAMLWTHRTTWTSGGADAALLAAFGIAYIAVLRSNVDLVAYDYARILVLIPAFVAAFRHGWRGAAIALALCSLLVALVPAAMPTNPSRNLYTQMLLALAGSASLLLGAAIDAQRASRAALAAQNVALESANAGLDHLGAELRDAAQRNLRLEEEQRRRIATEIHDELGQNLTAVHTRVKLAADRLNAAQLGDVTTSIYEILATMRGSVRGLMDSLRPPVLDEFGLVRALREGPLRDLAERAGLRYEFDLRGDPALIAALDEATQIAIWRIVQEAATNTVRHARATSFSARLRVGVRNANALAILDLRDDGIGIADATAASRGGHGLQGMRDRALALNGVMRVAGNPKGTRLRVLLRQAL